MALDGILSIIIVLVVLGIIGWAVNVYAPMDARFKQLVNIVLFIVGLVIVLKFLLGLV